MSLPTAYNIPKEMRLGSLDDSMPPESRSWSAKVQPVNYSSVTTPTVSAPLAAGSYLGDTANTIQNFQFDIPCSQSPSTFLDTRFTTLNFTARFTGVAAGTTCAFASGHMRSGALSWFDRMTVVGQNGVIIEEQNEVGLVADTMNYMQMSQSDMVGSAITEGFRSDGYEGGHAIEMFTGAIAATDSFSYSYSIPLPSGIVGVLNDSFLNIGRTRKLQLNLQTASIIPITILRDATLATVAAQFNITLEDFSLGLEYIDIGLSALQQLDKTLIGGKAYSHGITYRTTSTLLPATSGSVSLPIGISSSSVKSLFTRFTDGGDTDDAANSVNGKYDSKNPIAQGLNYTIGGLNYPQSAINPLLNASQAFRELQLATGAFNNSAMHSAITHTYFCKLSAGGTAQADTVGTAQNYYWNLDSEPDRTCKFIFGVDLEVCAKRGLLSGLDCSKSPVAIKLNIKSTPDNTHQVYSISMVDHIIEHDIQTGDIEVRI